ncbi:NAD(P)H-binding protein [Bordetella bronchialis]|uniref:NAD-dependent epimerase/dehydratase domain-containing protein n=1 Tax=Bordetella bronchialis TaxID=463025 RepID=A0A193FY84_9BORD|nr:NAD(P)H-binding protein [Bordetella bronchialis]ANN67074.1 hypothetical protein BAU06_12925 [Bordetella bronchialis]ANN72151.1 hypothetical protein BAU08_13120 [Bordetella bronchialis]
MRILLTGATGFIGRRLADALSAQGHQLRCVSRKPPARDATAHDPAPPADARAGHEWITLDYASALTPDRWTHAIRGCDAVINAAGIFRSRGANTLERVHELAPRALFLAAHAQGVRRVIQLSALGADEHARTAYHRSKKAGDDSLRALGMAHAIVQPSLVFGPDGPSSRFFMMVASLPWIPLPGHGDSRIQPVHVDDLVQAVAALLALPERDMPRELPLVGPAALTLRSYYACLRAGMGIRRGPRYVPLPLAAMKALARAGDRLGAALFNSEALEMLARGNTGDPAPLRRLLGRPPRPAQGFIGPSWAGALATQARAAWLLPLLRWSIAVVWLVTAAVSAFGYPLQGSYALLDRAGVPAAWQPAALYGAIALDLLLGVALLMRRRPRWIWAAQGALILGYTAIISLRLPEYWLHPYGPLVKNLPMLAALWLLYELEDRPWTS